MHNQGFLKFVFELSIFVVRWDKIKGLVSSPLGEGVKKRLVAKDTYIDVAVLPDIDAVVVRAMRKDLQAPILQLVAFGDRIANSLDGILTTLILGSARWSGLPAELILPIPSHHILLFSKRSSIDQPWTNVIHSFRSRIPVGIILRKAPR